VALPKTEAFIAESSGPLDGDPLREAIAADVAMLDVIGDGDASAEYRRHIAAVVARRAILGAAEAAFGEVPS
jgi:CO/xanthine dehydrogenase FAD-binding subunit